MNKPCEVKGCARNGRKSRKEIWQFNWERQKPKRYPSRSQKEFPNNSEEKFANIPAAPQSCLASASQICGNKVGRSARNETWELCCGSGHLAIALGNVGFKSHGVDLDDSKFHFKVDGDRKQSSRVSFHTWDLLDDSVVNRFCFQLSQGWIQ